MVVDTRAVGSRMPRFRNAYNAIRYLLITSRCIQCDGRVFGTFCAEELDGHLNRPEEPPTLRFQFVKGVVELIELFLRFRRHGSNVGRG